MGIVTVVGDIMLDLTFIGVPSRISPEQAHTLVHEMDGPPVATLGGAGNVARVLAEHNRQAKLIGQIGNDAYGTMLLDECHRLGVGVENIQRDDHPTTLKARAISRDGTHYVMKGRWDRDRSIMCESPICELPEDTDALIFSDYAKGMFPAHFDLTSKLIIGDIKPQTIEQLTKEISIDYILPNKNEMNQLKEIARGDDRLGLLGIRRGIVVTCGAEGAVWFDLQSGDSGTISIDEPLTGDHRSGAGDIFTAKFTTLILDGCSLEEATRESVRVSSHAATTGEIIW